MAQAETISAVSLIATDTHTDIKIDRSDIGDQEPKVFELKGENLRLVIDWPDAKFIVNGQKSDVGNTSINDPASLVKAIRHSRQGDSGLRIVFDLAAKAKFEASNIGDQAIVLRVKNTAYTAPKVHKAVMVKPVASVETLIRSGETAIPTPRIQPRKRLTPQVKKLVVIDPGHGGRDPGAIGVGKGTHEKVITFKAAKTLKAMLEKTGRYTVILTRNDDSYVKHADRIKVARIKNADLFISIHADSTKSKTARGASVYTLADRAKNRSKRIVNSQNWIMDVDLSQQSDPVGDILVDLAQRKTLSQSTMFADVLIRHLSGSTRLIGNTHRRAGYYVLLAPDVPAVLLELGFLSNPSDEKLLRTASHRQKVMRSVVAAIDDYFKTQNP